MPVAAIAAVKNSMSAAAAICQLLLLHLWKKYVSCCSNKVCQLLLLHLWTKVCQLLQHYTSCCCGSCGQQ
jgi:glutamate 5-kinase